MGGGREQQRHSLLNGSQWLVKVTSDIFKKQHEIVCSPPHCCNLSPKAGTSQLRCHSVLAGFVAGVLGAFSSVEVI